MTLYLVIFIVSIILFSLASSDNGFFFLILAIGLGCYYTILAFYEGSSLIHQLSLIGSYTILLAAIDETEK